LHMETRNSSIPMLLLIKLAIKKETNTVSLYEYEK